MGLATSPAAGAREQAQANGAPRSLEAHVADWLCQRIADKLDCSVERVDRRVRFRDLGLDSAWTTQMLLELSSWLGYAVPVTTAWEHPNVEALSSRIAEFDRQRSREQPAESGADRRAARTGAAGAMDDPIAVVGIGCRFPGGAVSASSYWQLLTESRNAIREVPPSRFRIDAFFDADVGAPGKMSTRWGGFVDHIDEFDALFFGVSPREAVQMDPQQRLMLEVAWEALEDASIPPMSLKGSASGVFIGAMWSDYARLIGERAERIGQHTATGQDTSVIAGRISYVLGLCGPSLVINTACSSSLVALHYACQALRLGEAALALAGGVSVIGSPQSTIALSKFGAMAPDGQCKAFDARANGYVRGEGAGLVVLKPLRDALRDGDRIYCVIRGSAVNNDGFSNGLTAPSPAAQQAVMRQACVAAGVSPADVDYVEAHGTGTFLGDPIEAGALGAVYGVGRSREAPLRIGSVKTNLGHLEAAAGAAGFIKVALSLYHGDLPASLNYRRPNPNIAFDALNVEVHRALKSWPDARRRALAGVSSFGFGGTNCHVIAQAATAPAELVFPLAADDPAGLRENALALLDVADRTHTRADFEQASRDQAHVQATGEYRWAVTAPSAAALADALLERVRSDAEAPAPIIGRAKVVWLCAGSGPLWPSAAGELYRSERIFRRALRRCDDAVRACGSFSVLEALFDGTSEQLSRIEVAQPVQFSIQIALAALWRDWGIEPAAVVGYSMGEVTAGCLTGALELEDAARIICRRSELFQTLSGTGASAVVAVAPRVAERAILSGAWGDTWVAAHNSPGSTLISGAPGAIEALVVELSRQDIYAARTTVDFPTHGPSLQPIGERLADAIADIRPRAAGTAWLSTVTTCELSGQDADPAYWYRNLVEPVRYAETIAKFGGDHAALFVELSTHPVLKRATEENLESLAARNPVYASLDRDDADRTSLLRTAAALYERGAPVDWRRAACPARRSSAGGDARLDRAPVKARRERQRVDEADSAHLLVLSSSTEAALTQLSGRYAAHLRSRPEQPLEDVCFTAAHCREHFERRLAVRGATREQLIDQLELYARGDQGPLTQCGEFLGGAQPKIAFLYTGAVDGSSAAARSLYEREPAFARALDRCVAGAEVRGAVAPLDRYSASGLFGSGSRRSEQRAAFAVGYALTEWLRGLGVRPDVVIGDGAGEYVAACAAGIISVGDALALMAARSNGSDRHGASKASDAELDQILQRASEPVCAVVSGLTGELATFGEVRRAAYWLAEPRRREASERGVRSALAVGCQVVVAMGSDPANRAQDAVSADGRTATWVAMLRAGQEQQAQWLRAIGALYCAGVSIDWTKLYPDGCKVELPSYAFQRRRFWILDEQLATEEPAARNAPRVAADDWTVSVNAMSDRDAEAVLASKLAALREKR